MEASFSGDDGRAPSAPPDQEDAAARRIQRSVRSCAERWRRRSGGGEPWESVGGGSWLWVKGQVQPLHEGAHKLGKGKARLLCPKYWMEAADPKHRHGSKLVPYYKEWLKADTQQSFFYWLDFGEGKDLDLKDQGHPRAKLRASRVEYLTIEQRRAYLVAIREDGLLYWQQSGELVHTGDRGGYRCLSCRFKWLGLPCKYIYVIDMEGHLYLGKKRKGRFHHSSFLGARPVRSGGGAKVDRGQLRVITASSGHYKPTPRAFERAVEQLGDGKIKETVIVYPSTKMCCFGRIHLSAALERLCSCRRRHKVSAVQPS